MRYVLSLSDNTGVFELYFNYKHFKTWLGLKKLDIPSLEDLWLVFRHKYCPTRILQYGTISRHLVGDDRTAFEKVCDYISEYFVTAREKRQRALARPNGFSFFDWGIGKKITNMSQIHEIERETGRELVSWRDQEVEQSKIKRNMEIAEKEKIKKKLHHVFSEVQKGRKYTQEIRKQKEEFVRSFE